MTEMFGEAWSPMSVPDLAPDDDDECKVQNNAFDFPVIERELKGYEQTFMDSSYEFTFYAYPQCLLATLQ